MSNNSEVRPFNGCSLEIMDKGAFRCKQAYIKLFSGNNQQLTLIDQWGGAGFHFNKFIPKDFCEGGIEIGYDVAWGMDFPLRDRFIHVNEFKNTKIDMNALFIKITGTTIYPYIYIRDGLGQVIEYYAGYEPTKKV